MSEPTTLVESLEQVADESIRGYSHLADARAAPVEVPHSELYARASRLAAALQRKGLRKGDRLGLIIPDSRPFVEAIFGAMLAGVVPVPVYPPMNLGQLDAYVQNTTHILKRAGCKMVLTDARVKPLLGQLVANAPEMDSIATMDRVLKGVDADARHEDAQVLPDDIAFLQFTSGSTSRPKGVTLTHANLVANIQAIGGGAGLQVQQDSRGLSWLPLYHDMGLIGFVFAPIHFKAQHVRFVSPLAFLKRPSVWLKQISETRANITFGPNFAYGLATKRVRDAELEGVDLSTLHVAGCGAEPIQFQTLSQFADRFEPFGFRRAAFLPCYGLAEHSLAVTFTGLADPLEADTVDSAAFADGKAERAASDSEHAVSIVNCGKAFPGHEIRIVSEQGGTVLGEREVGEIQLRGPSVMQGYFEDEAASQQALSSDGWLRSGDLGYLADQNLYVCGRIKDVIIIQGRNYHPQDVEWQASLVEGIRKGNCIAFGIRDETAQRERVVVACETREPAEEHETLARQVKTNVLDGLSLRVDQVMLLPPGSLPKTSSGKLQRAKAKQMAVEGTLRPAKAGGSGWTLAKHVASSGLGFLKARLSPK